MLPILALILLLAMVAIWAYITGSKRIAVVTGVLYLLLVVPVCLVAGFWMGAIDDAFCLDAVVHELRALSDNTNSIDEIRSLMHSLHTKDYATECSMILDGIENFKNAP